MLDHIACITGEKVVVKLALCLITCDITKSFQGVEKQLCIFVNTAVSTELGMKQVTASCPVCFIAVGRRSPEMP